MPGDKLRVAGTARPSQVALVFCLRSEAKARVLKIMLREDPGRQEGWSKRTSSRVRTWPDRSRRSNRRRKRTGDRPGCVHYEAKGPKASPIDVTRHSSSGALQGERGGEQTHGDASEAERARREQRGESEMSRFFVGPVRRTSGKAQSQAAARMQRCETAGRAGRERGGRRARGC